MGVGEKLRDVGEKEIIRSIIIPFFNPTNILGHVGDDCAILNEAGNKPVCFSTDRVPADLISFKLGLIDYFELGYYLVILNISDIAAVGAVPVGILLNLAFNNDFLIEDFKKILEGAKKACDDYNCSVLGGDLSNSQEMNLCATSIGIVDTRNILYRRGASENDYIFCSDYLGLTSTAFYYFLQAKHQGLMLTDSEEELLVNQFKKPKARIEVSRKLTSLSYTVTCMDNTDGIGQSFIELSEINALRFELEKDLLPIHPLSFKIAEFLRLDVMEIILGRGADFQLVGTISKNITLEEIKRLEENRIFIIGRTVEGEGIWIKENKGTAYEFNISGWNYFNSNE